MATQAVLVGIWLIVNGIGTIALSLAICAESEPARPRGSSRRTPLRITPSG